MITNCFNKLNVRLVWPLLSSTRFPSRIEIAANRNSLEVAEPMEVCGREECAKCVCLISITNYSCATRKKELLWEDHLGPFSRAAASKRYRPKKSGLHCNKINCVQIIWRLSTLWLSWPFTHARVHNLTWLFSSIQCIMMTRYHTEACRSDTMLLTALSSILNWRTKYNL